MSLGSNIAAKRKELKLSQEYIAEQLGVSRQAVSKWETGQTEPTAKNLVELARLFHVTVSDLVEPEKIAPSATTPPKKDWRLGLERFAVIAYSGAAMVSTIETNEPGFTLYCAILILIPAVIMAINIMRLPAHIRTRMAILELCYCLVIYCVVTFLNPIIHNVYTSIIVLICCVVYLTYIRCPIKGGS